MSNDDQEAFAAANLREHLRDINLSDASEAFPHAGLVQDDQRQQILNQLALAHEGDIEEEEAYQDLVQPAGTETITDAVSAGNVSQMQYAVGLVDHSEDGEEAKPRVARMLAREGCIGLTVGPPGAGKTAFALDVARIWKALTNGTVVSNVASWDGTDRVVETADEMLDAMQDTRGQVLAFIDEGAQALTSRGEDQQKTDAFAKDLKLVRKKGDGDRFAKQGSVLIVGHTDRDTAAEIRRLATFVAEKPSRKDPGRLVLYESEGGRDSMDKSAEYQGITDTPEAYQEHEASDFDVILDDGDDANDGDDTDVQRREAIRTVVRAEMRGDTHEEAAQLVEYSDSWAGDRWREWLRGKHRDIVEMPENPPEPVQAALERID